MQIGKITKTTEVMIKDKIKMIVGFNFDLICNK